MDYTVEGAPDDDQKERLEDFLFELMLVCKRHGVHLIDADAAVELIDSGRGTIIGLGLFADVDAEDCLKRYLPHHSILDGVWPVDSPDGVTEQRFVQNTYPRRDPETFRD